MNSTILRICIDAGHGLSSYKSCLKSLDPNQTKEWWLNDRVADKLESALKDYDCEVIRTDDTTGKTDVSLSKRVLKANNFEADVFISIHHNGGINGGSGGGTTVFYCSSKAERKKQAQALYDAVVKQTKLVGNRSSKIVKKGFTVIKKTTMPAFLIENGFMDSKVDVPIILSEAHADKTVVGIINFLTTEFALQKTVVEEKEPVQQSYGLKTLKRGSTGNDVTIFESILKKLGYYGGEIDINFGPACVKACNDFQQQYPECGTNGKPDSSWGPACWKKVLSILKA